MTVRLNLSAPFAPLLAQLADRAGMMVSPKAAQAAGDKFGAKPVCSGPFRFVERVAQDRIVLERYRELLEQGRDPRRQDRLPADRRLDGAARQPQVRAARLHRAHGALRRARAQDRHPLQDLEDHRDRLPGHHDQRRQERSRAEEPAGQGSARARGVRAGARPRGHRAGRDGRRGGGRQPVGRAGQPVLREEHAGPEARRRAGEGAAAPKPACRTRASR